jgi:hypothetical protein
MYTVRRKYLDKVQRRMFKREHNVYNKNEAGDYGIDYVHWKDVRREGQWVLTDDGFVVECLKFYPVKNPRGGEDFYRVDTPIGRAITYKNATLVRDQPRRWVKQVLGETPAKEVVTAYVAMRVSGSGIDWDSLAKLYKPKDPMPMAQVKRLFKQPETKAIVREEIQKQFTESGFTVKRVLAEVEFLINMAKTKEDLNILKDTVFKLADMLDMVPEKRHYSFSMRQQLPTGGGQAPIPLQQADEMDKMLEATPPPQIGDGKQE